MFFNEEIELDMLTVDLWHKFIKTFFCKEIIIENSNTSWDYLCVELSHNSLNSKAYLLCNVYRLPCYLAAEIDLFTAEFSNVLCSPKRSHSSVFICGNFNINLLSININAHFADYLRQ